MLRLIAIGVTAGGRKTESQSDIMARVIFDGLMPEQAKHFAHWFEGQGEQDIVVWFESQDPPVDPPMTNMKAKPRWLEQHDEVVIVHCHTP